MPPPSHGSLLDVLQVVYFVNAETLLADASRAASDMHHTHECGEDASTHDAHVGVSTAALELLCSRLLFLDKLFAPRGMDVMVVVSRSKGRKVPLAAVAAALRQVDSTCMAYGDANECGGASTETSSMMCDDDDDNDDGDGEGDVHASKGVSRTGNGHHDGAGECDVEDLLDAVLERLAGTPGFR